MAHAEQRQVVASADKGGRSCIKEQKIHVARVMGDDCITRGAEVRALHDAAAAETVDGGRRFFHVSRIPQCNRSVVAGCEQSGLVFDVDAAHFLSMHVVHGHLGVV